MDNLLYALDSTTGEWCNAEKCDRSGNYVCWCPDKHPVFVRRPTGKEGVRLITAHFAHYRSLDNNNNQLPSVCRKGGESVEHMNAKMVLKTMAGLFSFVTMQCPECSKEVIEDCSNGIVVLELRSDDNKWRYDAVYTDVHGKVTALEVCHSHATTDEKIKSTRSKGIRIAEFSAENILLLAKNEKGGRLDNLVIESAFCSLLCKTCVLEREERECEEKMRRQERETEERVRRQERETERVRMQEQKRLERICRMEKAEETARQKQEEQLIFNKKAAEKKWIEAKERHVMAVSLKKKKVSNKKQKIIPTSSQQQQQQQPVSEEFQSCRSNKKERNTYNLGSFGFYPPNSRQFIQFCHHSISRRKHCMYCAESEAEST